MCKKTFRAVFGFYAVAYTGAYVNHRDRSQPQMWVADVSSTIVMHTKSTSTLNSSDDDNDLEDREIIRSETSDPDGVPLFDTNDRATLFGLEPNVELDPLDNPGLQFTGPLIMFLSIYVTLSLFFAGDGDLVLFDNIQ
jgi:hypothetical protein